MRFSDRIGVTKPRQLYQLDDIDKALKNRLWNNILSDVFPGKIGEKYETSLTRYSRVFDEFFKLRNDQTGSSLTDKDRLLKEYYFEKFHWYKVYNFLEFIVTKLDPKMETVFNKILEEEKSAYRFVDQKLVPISDEIEIEAVRAATNLEDKFSGAREHIQKSLVLLAQKPKADYANAIKEAISAVESMAKVLSKKDKATLKEAIEILNQQKPMHRAFKEGIVKLYAYTSDHPHIRHGSSDDTSTVDEPDAHFMIVVCSAIVNFVASSYR